MIEDAVAQIAGIINTFPGIKETVINIKSPLDSLLEKTNFRT
ncbi:hypothetical protein [Polaribacter litorisediminis]|nr:hypothetical protein [Polaribacter litorisediminis]